MFNEVFYQVADIMARTRMAQGCYDSGMSKDQTREAIHAFFVPVWAAKNILLTPEQKAEFHDYVELEIGCVRQAAVKPW